MKISNTAFYSLLALAVAVNFLGLTTHFFTDDPGLYASIAKQMVYRNDYLNLYSYGRDWLDKPHFPFWMVALSFKIFGIYDWSYRIPALLFFFTGVFYTYLFTVKFYGKDAARLAVLIVLVAQHGMMSNTDVRAEPYLFGCLIAALYHLSNLKDKVNYAGLVAVAFFTACAIMTKGIFVFIAIYSGLLAELYFTRRLSLLKQARYWLLLLLTFIFIMPEIWALYIQFDLHSEKVVFGHTHVSGVRFFFWDSQFGRFFNTGPINRQAGSKVFFLHTLLWAYAPWCFMLYLAICKTLKSIARRKLLKEYYTITGSVIMLLLFSLSGFQLPFYTNILFPLFSILIAGILVTDLSTSEKRFIISSQMIYILVLPILIIAVNFAMVTNLISTAVFGIAIVLALIAGIIYVFKSAENRIVSAIYISVLVLVFANSYIGINLYPRLAANKAELQAAEFINRQAANHDSVFVLQNKFNSFQFYVNRSVKLISIQEFNAESFDQHSYCYAHQEDIDLLNSKQVKYKIVRSYMDYDHEGILAQFLSPQTRPLTLSKVYLISK